jgi:menaquinone-9 beta-reductase
VAPRGGRVDVAGRLAVLPRQILDDILRRAAVDAGARWMPQVRFVQPLEDAQGRVIGARFDHLVTRDTLNVRARWVVLATGAVPQALLASGMVQRRTPSGVALRGYLHSPSQAAHHRTMDVIWHRALGRGYGWIFPARDGVFNVGVGLAHSHAQQDDGRNAMADVNLRELFDTFCRVHPPAQALVASGTWAAPLKGAPLRCSLEGSTLARPGLLVTGEAAGTTYAFTGEGIGKAMESGMLAAEAIGRAKAHATSQTDPGHDDQVHLHYAQALQALKPRFDLYERAYKFNESPWMIDLLVWRAKRSPGLMRRMEGVLEERSNPGNMTSWRALLKTLWST